MRALPVSCLFCTVSISLGAHQNGLVGWTERVGGCLKDSVKIHLVRFCICARCAGCSKSVMMSDGMGFVFMDWVARELGGKMGDKIPRMKSFPKGKQFKTSLCLPCLLPSPQTMNSLNQQNQTKHSTLLSLAETRKDPVSGTDCSTSTPLPLLASAAKSHPPNASLSH